VVLPSESDFPSVSWVLHLLRMDQSCQVARPSGSNGTCALTPFSKMADTSWELWCTKFLPGNLERPYPTAYFKDPRPSIDRELLRRYR
jgi:hypothetical protein